MTHFQKFLFPTRYNDPAASRVLFAFRLIFGVLLLHHGIMKIANFDAMVAFFPDLLGIGSVATLSLAIFAEVACSLAFMAGFLYRLSMLPMLATLGFAFFGAHGGSLANGGELALIYLVTFAILYVTGPGRYSIDNILRNRSQQK